MDVGLIGGIVGTIGGVAGGVAGTYFGIKNTHSPKERAFVVRAAVLLWIGVIGIRAPHAVAALTVQIPSVDSLRDTVTLQRYQLEPSH